MPEQDPSKLTKKGCPSEELGAPFMLGRTKRAIGARSGTGRTSSWAGATSTASATMPRR